MGHTTYRVVWQRTALSYVVLHQGAATIGTSKERDSEEPMEILLQAVFGLTRDSWMKAVSAAVFAS